MALRKEFKSKLGVTGDYMAIHAISYNNESKATDYSVALYVNEDTKRSGANPLDIIYQGSTTCGTSDNILEQCYMDLKNKSIATIIKDSEEIPSNPIEHSLFYNSEDV